MALLLSMPGGSEWILVFFLLGIFLIPRIFYLIALQSTLDTISVENRKMAPSNVWLQLIPLFGIAWHFVIINNLADSIKAEANSKNIRIDELRPAYSVGLAMCILNCLFFIPILNVLTIIASLICWILYWVKINSYKRILMAAKMYSFGQ
jgi:hypothetical protein